ncbi:MAG: cation transporter [Nitrospirae bacterium]|nr:cation transporter [Nitrospirota bacterium]
MPETGEHHVKGQTLVLVVTIAYFFVELIGGLYYHSIALVTDASFMAVNISGQIIALWVTRIVRRQPDKVNTFGYERAKVLSGLFNGILVGFILFYVFTEAFQKLLHPQPIEADKVLIIAIIGLFANAFGLIQLYRYSKDVNIKGALLLILNDTLGSVGVIGSAIIIWYTHLYFVDPLAGILIGCLAAYPTYFLIRDSVKILMEGNTAHIDADDVSGFLHQSFPEIHHVKDVHIWGLSPEKVILVARIRTHGSGHGREAMKLMKRMLRKQFGFYDVYIEGYEGKPGEVSSAPAAVSSGLPAD